MLDTFLANVQNKKYIYIYIYGMKRENTNNKY